MSDGTCYREWVAKCLGQITESNRAEVQSELKQVIGEAFAAQTLWTTDWAGVQLKRSVFFMLAILAFILAQSSPKAFAAFQFSETEKVELFVSSANSYLLPGSFEPVPPANGKKAKKAALKATLDYGDKHALEMRAQRFQREHAIERTKATRTGGQDSPQTYSPHSHLFNRSTSTSSPYTGIDEPEGDPVCPLVHGILQWLTCNLRMSSIGTSSLSLVPAKKSSRIIYVSLACAPLALHNST